MAKRAVIIHCWEGTPEYCWYPWAKDQLEQNGFEVVVPQFPDTKMPNLNKWLPTLQEVIGKPDRNLYLIGHSTGCITILRYLESLKGLDQVGGVVLVAGFIDNLGYEELKNFFTTPINFAKIKKHCRRFTIIHSDDDPYVKETHPEILKQELGAKVIVKHNAGHFSGPPDTDPACKELPEVISSVLEQYE